MTPRRRQPRGPATGILIAIVAIVALAGAAWWWLGARDPGTPAAAVATPPSRTDTDPTETVETLDLPDLDFSDVLIRELVSELSEHPRLAAWLVTDELVRRFVGVVIDLAGGLSPRSRVEFLIPDEEFVVREDGETLWIDPASYRRYDLLTETFVSLDTQGTAQLYHRLHPLFEEAYAELGIPDQEFDDAMTLAVDNLLAAQVPEGPVELQPNEAIYEFSDIRMETLSPAEKHLVRMGPENARQIQTKLSAIWAAIQADPR